MMTQDRNNESSNWLYDLFADLDEPPEEWGTKPAAPKQQFACVACAGTGRYQGARVHQPESKCFACNGRGWFRTSPEYRRKQRAQRKRNKAAKLEEQFNAFVNQHRALVDGLREVAGWNDFARDLLNQLLQRGSLSEKQVAAAERMLAKIAAKRAERAAAEGNAPEAEAYPQLAELFTTAATNLKWPKLRLRTESDEPVVIGRCGEQSKTPGHLRITDGRPYGEGQFFGTIAPDGTPNLRRNAPDEVRALLRKVEADPAGEARVQGQRTGRCSCCGAELTDANSIAAGIGPICAGKWSL